MFEFIADINVSLLLFGTFAAMLIIGVPIVHALGASTLLVFYAHGIQGVLLPQTAYNATDKFPLMAVPFFVLAGYLMEFGGLSRRIIDLAEALIGHIVGGLACVTILACMFFAAISGSGPATTAAIGTLMIPAMVRIGYSKPFSGAVASTGGTIGIMIPPSNPMIIYGVVGNVSITSLFIAGALPGVLVGIALMLGSWWICKRKAFLGLQKRKSWREIFKAFLNARWALIAPVIILGGIYTGIFTPTEASIVAVAYGLFVGLFVYRELNWKTLYDALFKSVVICGTVTIMVGLAGAFGRLLTMYQIPQQLGTLVLSISDNWFIVLMLFNISLIIIGTFMETLATIIIITPILLPVAIKLGVDPIHFGVLLVITSELGFLTPPLGANLFVALQITEISLEDISRAVLPFILILILITIILTAIPQISLFLPSLLR